MSNPVRSARQRLGLTLKDLGQRTGVHWQAVYGCEQGVYATILPALLRFFVVEGFDSGEMSKQYAEYQRAKRKRIGVNLSRRLGPPSLLVNPIVAFRRDLGFSRQGFCKALCVHPATMYSLESGTMLTLPKQFKEALSDAGFPDDLVRELATRLSEYVELRVA